MIRCVDLTASRPDRIGAAARLLRDAFLGRSADWQDLASARVEVDASLEAGRISRAAIDGDGALVGWIGAIPIYDGHVWELHPLVVDAACRRQGIGRALVRDVEALARARGVSTLFVGSDDERGETSLSQVDLYGDVAGAIRGIRNLAGHPYEFYLRVGFTIVGVVPDANGPGRPDILLAKRVASSENERHG